MFSTLPTGTRTRGTQPHAAMMANICDAVSRLVGACSSSTLSQSKPVRAINCALIGQGRLSQVPTLGSPAFEFGANRIGFHFDFRQFQIICGVALSTLQACQCHRNTRRTPCLKAGRQIRSGNCIPHHSLDTPVLVFAQELPKRAATSAFDIPTFNCDQAIGSTPFVGPPRTAQKNPITVTPIAQRIAASRILNSLLRVISRYSPISRLASPAGSGNRTPQGSRSTAACGRPAFLRWRGRRLRSRARRCRCRSWLDAG
jgi:hypothetical protein